jgi:hypothetical protein
LTCGPGGIEAAEPQGIKLSTRIKAQANMSNPKYEDLSFSYPGLKERPEKHQKTYTAGLRIPCRSKER